MFSPGKDVASYLALTRDVNYLLSDTGIFNEGWVSDAAKETNPDKAKNFANAGMIKYSPPFH